MLIKQVQSSILEMKLYLSGDEEEKIGMILSDTEDICASTYSAAREIMSSVQGTYAFIIRK